jgi:putative ABC transport system permease protein
VSAAAFCPAAAALIGWGLAALARRGRGISLLLASKAVAHNPRGPIAVIIAIVMGLGWTLADASLIESFRTSWLTWIDRYYQSDLILGAGPTTVSFLTGPPFTSDVVTEIGRDPRVRAIQGQRIVDVTYRGHPVAVQAMDPAAEGLDVRGARWSDVAERFWAGRGVAASQQLAHLEGLAVGDEITLVTPAGERSFPIVAVFTDFRVGTLGSLAMSRELYRTIWNDSTVNSIRVWAVRPEDVPRLRASIHARFGASYGIQAVTAADFRRAVFDLTENIFALHYTVVLIALLVSVVGVTNFLLASVLDRAAEHRTLAATGVTRWQVAGSIVIEGALLGVIGGAIGFVTGTVVSRIIVEHSVPMVNGWHFDWMFPVGPAVRLSAAVVALSALAGLLPARLATRRAAALEAGAQ